MPKQTGGSPWPTINNYADISLIIQSTALPVHLNKFFGICYTSEVGNIHASKAVQVGSYKA